MNTPDFRNYKNAEIDKTIDAAMTSLRTITGNSMDLNIMNVKICSVSCALVSIEGMISTSAYFQTYNGAFCTKVKGQFRAGIRLPDKRKPACRREKNGL